MTFQCPDGFYTVNRILLLNVCWKKNVLM